MPNAWGRYAALVAVVFLSGCAGVPQLYRPDARNPSKTLAPKVDHIVDEIACELRDLSKTHLSEQPYIITVLLTLQVDDEINLTPSLSFIEPLSTAGTNRTLTENLGVGGARQRSFTSTFYFDSSKIAAMDACGDRVKKLYRLDGNLGLAEIARDGIGIGTKQEELKSGAAPSPPTFASQVKFVVTRSVGALGPTWTLTSFKGPGGANGLLNGKALTTDSVNVAFAPKPKPKMTPAEERVIDALQSIIDLLKKREQESVAAVAGRQAALNLTRRAEAAKLARFKSFSPEERRRSEQAILSAADAVGAAEQQRLQATQDRQQAETNLATARDAASQSAGTRANEDAIATGQSLINTMILQNLNVQPR
jgi:hypothetical protein